MIKESIKKRFDAWWANKQADRPMIRLCAERDSYDKSGLIDLSGYTTPEQWHSDPEFRVGAQANYRVTHEPLYDYIYYTDINYGPGAMAAYLGVPPQFAGDTVWYSEYKTDNLTDIPLPRFNKDAPLFQKHLQQNREAVRLSNGRFPIGIPDILENLDILALLRGNQELCCDLMDEPEAVKKYLDAVAGIYMKYYDAFYDVVRGGADGHECMYMGFSVWGRKKTAKIQCDFSGLVSPGQFEEFVLPYLDRQTREIPYTLYHLDGKDAVRHLPALMKLDKLKALQWTPGAGQPDGGDEKWYPIYDAVMDAGKSLWLYFQDGTPEDMLSRSEKIAQRYNNRGLYFHYFQTIKQKDKDIFFKTFGDGE